MAALVTLPILTWILIGTVPPEALIRPRLEGNHKNTSVGAVQQKIRHCGD